MMADQSAAPAAAQETTPVYNWATQNAQVLESAEDVNAGAVASFSCPPGQYSNQQVDDWHLC